MLGKVLLFLSLIISLSGCVTVNVYNEHNALSEINTYILVSDPDTVTTRAQVTGQKNLVP